MSALDDLRYIRRLALIDGSEAAMRVAGGIDLYEQIARSGGTLDEALRLKADPGHRPWWAVEITQRRNAAIKRIAAEFFADQTSIHAGRRIAIEMDRYFRGAWQRHKNLASAPMHLTPLVARIFDLLKLKDRPLSCSSIEKILNNSDT